MAPLNFFVPDLALSLLDLLDPRCNAMFSYCHRMSSVCMSSICDMHVGLLLQNLARWSLEHNDD